MDGDDHVVCVWRYINEWWGRYFYENELTGTIPSELGELTNLYGLYVLFTLLSLPVAHSRTLSLLPPARSGPFDVLFFFSPGCFAPLIVLVSTFLSSA